MDVSVGSDVGACMVQGDAQHLLCEARSACTAWGMHVMWDTA